MTPAVALESLGTLAAQTRPRVLAGGSAVPSSPHGGPCWIHQPADPDPSLLSCSHAPASPMPLLWLQHLPAPGGLTRSSKSSTRVHFLCLELGDLETLRAGWTLGPPRGQVSLSSEAKGCPPACRDHGQRGDGLTVPGHLTVTAGPVSNVSLSCRRGPRSRAGESPRKAPGLGFERRTFTLNQWFCRWGRLAKTRDCHHSGGGAPGIRWAGPEPL